MAGGGAKAAVINIFLHTPVQAYLGLGATLGSYRWYCVQHQYNYWFGKFHMQRAIERNTI